jgi:linoleoyl-CoA desaturase
MQNPTPHTQHKLHFQEKKEAFYSELRQEVQDFIALQSNGRYANAKAAFVASLLFAGFLGSYFLIITAQESWQLFLGYAMLGPFGIFLVLNVGHDASHLAFSSKKWVNQILLLSFNLLGISGYMWKLRHVHSHHFSPNVPDWDVDISQSKIVRLSPRTVFWNVHRYQHIYMPFLYLLYTLNMFLVRDFFDFQDKQIGNLKVDKHPRKELFILIATKVFFLSYLFVVPLLLTDFPWYQVLLGFLLAEVMASLFLTFILVSAHVGEESIYPEPGEDLSLPHSWAYHQILTTTDFATHSPLVTHLYGAFNHHTVHHLFPYVCHIHYPDLTRLMVNCLERHGLRYNLNPRLIDAIWSHYKLLYKHSLKGEALPMVEM